MTKEQAMACTSCGLAGVVPDEHFPQVPGLWDRPCPQCGEQAVWVTEVCDRIVPLVEEAEDDSLTVSLRYCRHDYHGEVSFHWQEERYYCTFCGHRHNPDGYNTAIWKGLLHVTVHDEIQEQQPEDKHVMTGCGTPMFVNPALFGLFPDDERLASLGVTRCQDCVWLDLPLSEQTEDWTNWKEYGSCEVQFCSNSATHKIALDDEDWGVCGEHDDSTLTRQHNRYGSDQLQEPRMPREAEYKWTCECGGATWGAEGDWMKDWIIEHKLQGHQEQTKERKVSIERVDIESEEALPEGAIREDGGIWYSYGPDEETVPDRDRPGWFTYVGKPKPVAKVIGHKMVGEWHRIDYAVKAEDYAKPTS